jgi:hypothetical protein
VIGAGQGLGYANGEFHDQGDTKWIVMRGQLRGHNDMPFGPPTPDRPAGAWPLKGRTLYF